MDSIHYVALCWNLNWFKVGLAMSTVLNIFIVRASEVQVLELVLVTLPTVLYKQF